LFCPHCGAFVEDSAVHCPQCGGALRPAAAPAAEIVSDPSSVKDYLTVNIVLLVLSVLCCGSVPSIVTGIIGVVFSSQARDLLRAGKWSEAAQKSRTARAMAIATGILLGVMALLLILLVALYGTVIFALLANTSY
jgi:hypothetical protein